MFGALTFRGFVFCKVVEKDDVIRRLSSRQDAGGGGGGGGEEEGGVGVVKDVSPATSFHNYYSIYATLYILVYTNILIIIFTYILINEYA